MPRQTHLAPLITLLALVGAALLILAAGTEIITATRAWLAGEIPLPKEIILHVLVAAAAVLLSAAVIMTRGSARRTAAAEAARRESEERLRLVANNVPALISYVDRDQRYRFSNRTYDDWFGIAHERMQGRTVAEVFGEEAYARMRPDIERCMAGAAVEFEFATTEGGKPRTLQVACVPHLSDESEVLGFYMLANDVTALKRAQEDLRFAAAQLQYDAQRLEFLAHHDTLTGLPNRAMFADRAREAVAHARRHAKTAAFLFLDMDNFKQVNDRLGHEVGDELLKMMASRLRASVRGDDFVARIGGDEFCVLLQEIAEPREAAAVAQKLILELGKPYLVGEHEVSSGASIGIACVPQDGDDVNRLLRLADHAMYRAKELGRNGYQFFSGLLNDNAEAAAELAEELRAAAERGELFLAYQPRFDIATRQVVGAEALLRWRHPRHGVLAPEAFLPLADDMGLLAELGGWILHEACVQGRRWLDAGIRPFSLVVNMSARQLRAANLASRVREALRASGLPAESLLVEVPETAVRQPAERVEQALAEITAGGARLSVDDFGTGYASLPMLQRLRASSVCIDRSLIAGVPNDPERAGLARALIALARGLDFEVVAKGVETQAQREFLAEAGCRICQGELFSPARSSDEVEPFLRARRAA
jgi:diguanylate cyclase (GGDEF)-like protein/PAS domain S-box-containing protein